MSHVGRAVWSVLTSRHQPFTTLNVSPGAPVRPAVCVRVRVRVRACSCEGAARPSALSQPCRVPVPEGFPLARCVRWLSVCSSCGTKTTPAGLKRSLVRGCMWRDRNRTRVQEFQLGWAALQEPGGGGRLLALWASAAVVPGTSPQRTLPGSGGPAPSSPAPARWPLPCGPAHCSQLAETLLAPDARSGIPVAFLQSPSDRSWSHS